MASQNNFVAWRNTKAGLIVIVLVCLLLAYTFASLAIGSGRLSEYTVAIIFLVVAFNQTVKFFKKVLRRG